MKTLLKILGLLILLSGRLSGQPNHPVPLREQIGIWLNPSSPTQTRLNSFLELFSRNEFQAALLQSHATKRKAVTEALVFSFDHGHFGHQCAALQLGVWVQDRSCYSRMIEPALQSPNHEVRSIALGAAVFFDDRSEVVVSGIVTEIGNTNLITARGTASQLAVKWNLPEAVEPLLNLVTHTNVTWAGSAAGSLAAYQQLPADALPKLEAALARAEFKATNMVRYTNTTLFPGQPVSHAWAVDGLVTALRKAKDKAQLPPSPDMGQARTVYAAKKTAKSTVGGKASPAASPAAQTNSPTSAAKPVETGRTSLLVLLGLASLAVTAWFLVKGLLR